jgi:hypothetical protein
MENQRSGKFRLNNAITQGGGNERVAAQKYLHKVAASDRRRRALVLVSPERQTPRNFVDDNQENEP